MMTIGRRFKNGEGATVKQNGFTLMELCVVIAIVSILAAITVPSFLKYRRDERVRAAASSLHGDLQKMKLEAIRKNESLGVVFTSSGYSIFKDFGSGTDTNNRDGDQDAGETTVRTYNLPSGVTLSSSITSFSFNSKGMLNNPGNYTITFTGPGNRQRFVEIKTLGYIKTT